MTTDTFSSSEARRIALAAQGFDGRRPRSVANWRRIRPTIERMGLLQIDSVNVLVRSHYLPVFSRIGPYNRRTFDERAFHPRRRELFEYWGHEASLLPFALHPLLRWRMARAERLQGIYAEMARFVRRRRDYIDAVLSRIRDTGALIARDLASPGQRGGMWEWHEGKYALEYLFWSGQVTAVTRRGFERVYDLPERVLPSEVLALPTPAQNDAQRELVGIAARALGIATEADLRDYFRLPVSDARRCVEELVESEALLPVRVEGWRQNAYLDPGARMPQHIRSSALLSPFDPLIWERKRTERLFGFRYRLEIYTPAAKRQHGYYVLPFLLNDRLVARVDLKADRAACALRVPAAYGESGTDVERVVEALRRDLSLLATWLGLERVVIGRRGNLADALR